MTIAAGDAPALSDDVQEDHGQHEHQDRADDPVLDEGERQHLRVAEHLAQFLVADLRQRRVHHDDQADGDRDGRRPDLERRDEPDEARQEVAGAHADDHGEEDPERQEPIEKRQARGDVFRHETAP